MKKSVGFDQKIELGNLDIAAREASYTERKDMYAKLDEYLRTDIKGDKSRKNAITMLMKIWYLADEEHEGIKQKAFVLFNNLPSENRLVLHWGMILLAYPFFKDVTDEMGNLLKLQNEVASQQVGRRIKMLYGDRRRVEVAINAVLTSMKYWGIIEAKKRQIYSLKRRIKIDNVELKNWLVEVILRISEYNSMPIDIVQSLTMLFPFDLNISINEIDTNTIKIDRQGLDTYMLSIQK
jgi:hypothetical protein